ncbi:MAG TPA: cytochrome b [Gammaproteobacteria bacterium]|nr:cytochrome b [Gammaproteobacteria bacterium]
MNLHNTDYSYGLIARSLHWIIALLIIAAWCVGYYATDLPPQDASKGMLFSLHKSVGMLILMLVIARLSWRAYDGSPKFANMNPLLVVAARTVHYLLYVFMFVQPISGWAMSSAAGYTPTFFGLFTFPALVAKNPLVVEKYVFIHNASAMVLLTLFIIHVGAALFHHFVLKDNTLRRMTMD